MVSEGDTAAEEALLLELAQLGLGMARQVHAATLSTTDAETLVALTGAYTRLGRGVRQSLALRARFAAGTVAPKAVAKDSSRSAAATLDRPERHEAERPDWNERSDWNERPDWNRGLAEREDLHSDPDVCRTRIARNLTVVSRTPALAAIPALRPQAALIAGRAALLAGATLRLVDTS